MTWPSLTSPQALPSQRNSNSTIEHKTHPFRCDIPSAARQLQPISSSTRTMQSRQDPSWFFTRSISLLSGTTSVVRAYYSGDPDVLTVSMHQRGCSYIGQARTLLGVQARTESARRSVWKLHVKVHGSKYVSRSWRRNRGLMEHGQLSQIESGKKKGKVTNHID
jgi:hypothetical protein